MLVPETVTFLEGGCALIVGTTSPSGEPHATRGWGVTVLSNDPPVVRLLIEADDLVAFENVATSAKIAVTGADVPSLHSIQFKGTVTQTEPATDDDRARAARYTDDFFEDIVKVDGTPRTRLDRLIARDYIACTVAISELYDQTPGPAAGAAMGSEPA